MNKTIITLQGILLKSVQEKSELGNGKIEYFVNGKSVLFWSYKKDGDEFYNEEIIIKDFAKKINTKTGKIT